MTKSLGVVVGYDGSDFSMQALDWAMDEAELRQTPLTVAHAWRWPYGEAADEAKAHLRKAAEHVLYHGADCARASSAIGEVRTELREGPAAAQLIDLSAGADLVVVGSRGLGRLASTLLGSVADEVSQRAHCPVVVVRGPGPLPVAEHPGPVVLALGDRPHDESIAFAFREAELRRIGLVVVHAQMPPVMAWGPAMAPVPDFETLIGSGERAMTERLEPWRSAHPTVRTEIRFAASTPLDAVQTAAGTASLLVVGAGHRAARLGSLPRSVLRHAPCPVAVVPRVPVTAERERENAGARA
ncbi:universal stress protein [Spongiactinospora sp. TRM90649]|uniref:universal stress protein n=1 Tax=Spongiactinospora sp. TRM90649 TaxID=3031114 RepID=UPI0023F9A9F4|nr:universal stress protein [Spongiactinospora sp. TRM90649]MDF5754337.1 universal stress protein [Spongiactinospora sp. TRM90649]